MKQFYLLPILVITPLFGQSLQPPTFSHESGFYNEEFQLNLTHEDPEVQIIYTLDGSEPDINNLEGRTYQYKSQYPDTPFTLPYEFYENQIISYQYNQPLLITNRENSPSRFVNIATEVLDHPYRPENVYKGTIVKAKAFYGDSFSEIITQNYFVSPEAANKYTLPVLAISADDEIFFGYENGMFVPGREFDEWRLNNLEATTTDKRFNANYLQSGSSSEKKIHMEYFVNNSSVLNQHVGLRLHGNYSRHSPNRSFRFYAKSGYGKSAMNYNFFPDNDFDKFKRIILRNSGNDTYATLFKDGFVQTLTKHLAYDTQDYQPTITFVNSEYYGIFNIRERFDEKYFERVYNINEDDIEILESQGIADPGDDVFFNQMLSYLRENSLASEETFEGFTHYIDVENFTDYYISEIYVGNNDWPTNNYEYWRKRTEYNPEAPYGHDGRFRWLYKDLDLSYDGFHVSRNDIEHSFRTDFDNDDRHTLIINKLIENDNYKKYFINRFSDLINTTFKTSRAINLIDSFKDNLIDYMPEFINRWNTIESMDYWQNRIENLKIFATERPTYQKQHLLDFFNLEGTYQLSTHVENVEHGFVKVNTIEINNSTVGIDGDYSTWSGDYFKGVPVQLQAVALPGYEFVRWIGDVESTEAELTVNGTEDLNITAVFERSLSTGDVNKVDFLIYPNPTSDVLNIASASKSEIKYTISNMLGQKVETGVSKDQTLNVSHLAKGVYLIELVQDNKRVVKKIIKK